MICWGCDYFFNHKKVDWKPRPVGMQGDNALGTTLLTNAIQEAEKAMGNKQAIASPNEIFGASEYEYRGQCPKCKQSQACFWFGKDSLAKNKNVLIEKKGIICAHCENVMDRAFQV